MSVINSACLANLAAHWRCGELRRWVDLMAIDSYRFLDFATRQVMKAWAAREEPGVIPFTPLAKSLRECTVALVSTAAVARNNDRPFDQDGEWRNPWWGDPSFR